MAWRSASGRLFRISMGWTVLIYSSQELENILEREVKLAMLLGFIKRPGLQEYKSTHFIQQTYLTPQIRKKSRSSAPEPKSAPRDAQEVSKVGCVTLSTQRTKFCCQISSHENCDLF